MDTDYDAIRRQIVEAFPKDALTIDPSRPDLDGFDGKGWKGINSQSGVLPHKFGDLKATARRAASYRLHRPGKTSEPLHSGTYRYPVEVRRINEHHDSWTPTPKPHRWQPHPADVIACLFLDASMADQTFADWCGDLGYSDDSIKARAVYDECQRTRSALLRIMGSAEAFDKLADLTSQL